MPLQEACSHRGLAELTGEPFQRGDRLLVEAERVLEALVRFRDPAEAQLDLPEEFREARDAKDRQRPLVMRARGGAVGERLHACERDQVDRRLDVIRSVERLAPPQRFFVE